MLSQIVLFSICLSIHLPKQQVPKQGKKKSVKLYHSSEPLQFLSGELILIITLGAGNVKNQINVKLFYSLQNCAIHLKKKFRRKKSHS